MSELLKSIAAGAIVIAGITAGGFATPAHAISSFDFANIADGGTFDSTLMAGDTGFEGNWNTTDSAGIGPVVGAGAGIVDNGITVWATGSNAAGTPADAFFDAGNAGLGVCSSHTCATGAPNTVSWDDNVSNAGGGEILTLTFSGAVPIVDILFRDANHNAANGTLLIDSVLYTITAGMLSAADLAAIGTATTFVFAYDAANHGGSATEFYISNISVVPLPATLLLLLGGLGCLGFVGRRKLAV